MDDAQRVIELITRIVDACPERRCATESERRAQDMLAEAYADAGAEVDWHAFRWNTHLFAVLALHFGVVAVGGVLLWVPVGFAPWVGAAMMLLGTVSYFGDSTRAYYWLRRAFPWRPSQNLLATLPATKPLRRRIVLVGHADATYTGWLFHPEMIKAGTRPPPIKALGFMRKSLLVVTGASAVASLLGLASAASSFWAGGATPWHPWLPMAATLATLPAWIAFVLNAQMVLNNTLVPGANDNLTGCAAGWICAERLRSDKPEDVELVFVCSGAEEAGTGGAYCLARDVDWKTDDTVVLAIDSLSNGILQLFIDGEIVRQPPPRWLLEAAERVRDREARFAEVATFEIPSGASDAMPFLARHFPAMGIGCVDPDIGAPRHYHWASDTPENVEAEPLAKSLDYVELLVRELWKA